MFSTIPSLIAKAFPGATGGPPPAWSPADIANLYDWWESSSGISTTGSSVNSWTGYNGIVLLPADNTQKPVYSASNSNWNNLPSVTTDDLPYETGMKTTASTAATSKTLMFVGKKIADNSDDDMIVAIQGTGTFLLEGFNPNKRWGTFAVGTYNQGNVGPVTFYSNSYIFARAEYDRSTGNYKFYVSDNGSFTNLIDTISAAPGINPGGTLQLANYTGYGHTVNASIVEFIAVDDIVSAGDITSYENYLVEKYVSPYVLDANPGAVYAFSLRKLSSTYSGSCIRVRRSSDNTEQDIGFAFGRLDNSALLNFCAGTDGYVKTWYDQSGNGNNATQTNQAYQPQIVSGGVINTVSGLGYSTPAIRFYGSDDYFNLPLVFDSATAATVFSVNKTVSNGGGFWNYNNNLGGATHHPWTDNNSYEGFGSTSRYGFSSEGLFVSQHLYTVMSKTNDWRAFINGVSKYTSGSNTVYFPNSGDGVPPTPPRLGVDASLAFFYNGFYQEHIVYTSDKLSSRTAIEGNINNYYNIF